MRSPRGGSLGYLGCWWTYPPFHSCRSNPATPPQVPTVSQFRKMVLVLVLGGCHRQGARGAFFITGVQVVGKWILVGFIAGFNILALRASGLGWFPPGIEQVVGVP